MFSPTQQQIDAANQNMQQKQKSDSKKASQRAYAESGPDTPPQGTPGAVRDATLQSFASTFHKGGVVSAPSERSSEYRKVYLKRKGK
jgi:hypothetical protein